MKNPIQNTTSIRIKTYILMFLGALCFLTSCVTRQRCLEKFPPSVVSADSVFRSDSTFVIRDTVTIPGETVIVRLDVPCPDVDLEKTFKKNGTTAKLTIKNGVATCEAIADSLERIIEIQNRTIKEGRHQKRREIVTEFKWYLPWWFWPIIIAAFFMGFKIKSLVGRLFGLFK